MSVQHSAITADADNHEPKGCPTATAGKVYVSNGAGSGAWQKVNNVGLEGISASPAAGYALSSDGAGGFIFMPAAHGSIYFSNFTTPYSLAATTAYQKVAPTTIADGSGVAITEGTNARLTYTGTPSLHLDVVFGVTTDQTSGSGKDIYLAMYKNGVVIPGSEAAVTTTTGEKVLCSIHRDVHVATNDYIEVYCKVSAAATVNFYTVNLQAGMAGS